MENAKMVNVERHQKSVKPQQEKEEQRERAILR